MLPIPLDLHHKVEIGPSRELLANRCPDPLEHRTAPADHDAALRTYALKNGKTATVHSTAPWTWQIHEIFQITGEGKISQIEAVLLSVPYGMRPGWSTGVHLPSPQAERDRFKEY